ncbi:hypothetical protein [uncultured Porphyromonas sp.]|uniref:RipA family octameric membrane protein n=1 Tax=uncultured Porphyromonas sp. TaxID=159274 RepID=UPI00260DE1E1|nr:hypothetical protein [uncultured Porphyromonas sp.]
MGKITFSWGEAPASKAPYSKPVSLKQLRKDFYKIRKFEIQNLWQRSIFLATFIIILFTAYGAFVEKLLAYDGLKAVIAHIICCLLALLGSIFSMIWIMMAKGSKAWFEIYERRIIGGIEAEETLNIPEKYRMGEGAPWTLDDSLWSRKPGAYSVSRINILLGQVLWVIWLLVFSIHLPSLALLSWFIYQDSGLCSSLCIIVSSICLAIIMYFAQKELPKALRIWVKSGAIKSPEEEEKTNKEKEDKRQ